MKIDCIGSGSKGNCYIIEFDTGEIIVIDAGFTYEFIMKKLGKRRLQLKAVLITHEHNDHSKAVKKMLKNNIHVYMSFGTASSIGVENMPKTHIIKHKDVITIGHVSIMPLDAIHNASEPLMFTIKNKTTSESMVFITDSAYVNYKLNGFNYYLIECNHVSKITREMRSKGIYSHSQNHMSLKNTIDLLNASDLSKCQKIILLHLSENNSDRELMIEEISKETGHTSEIAEGGKRWELHPTPF